MFPWIRTNFLLMLGIVLLVVFALANAPTVDPVKQRNTDASTCRDQANLQIPAELTDWETLRLNILYDACMRTKGYSSATGNNPMPPR